MTNISLNVTTTSSTSKHIDFSAWIQSSKVKLNVIHHMVSSDPDTFYPSKNTDLADLSVANSAYLSVGDTLEIVLNNRMSPFKTTPIAVLQVEHIDVRPVSYDGIPLLDSEERQVYSVHELRLRIVKRYSKTYKLVSYTSAVTLSESN